MNTLNSILIAGISFVGSSREDNLRSSTSKLKELFPEKTILNEILYKWQVNPHHYNLFFLSKRLISQWYLERNWHSQNGSHLIIVKSFIYLIYRMLVQLLVRRKNLIQNVNSNNMLTHKHYQIWNYFLNSDDKYLIVLEDDVIIHSDGDSIAYMEKILRRVEIENNKAIYIDLAGGLSIDQMKIKKQVNKQTVPLMELNIFASRTTCAYMINRDAASFFLNNLNGKTNQLDLYPIDWLVNLLGIKMKKNKVNFLCIHTQPPIFIHGSVDKKFPSSIPRG